MLYETLSQPLVFVILILCGFICGFLFDIFGVVCFLCKENKILNIVLNILGVCACCCILFFVNLYINYGELRIYVYIAFIISVIIERFTIGKLVAKIYYKCYNAYVNFVSKLKSKLQRKKKNGIKEEEI